MTSSRSSEPMMNKNCPRLSAAGNFVDFFQNFHLTFSFFRAIINICKISMYDEYILE